MKKVYVLLGLSLMLLLPTLANAGCDQDFYKTLRYGYQYTFGDNFSANGADRWIRTRNVDYSEQYDYNDSSSFPTFSWTSNIKNANWKVAKNTSMEVIKADSAYPIKKKPASRSYDNLLVKYTIKYSNDEAGSSKYEHTECAHYEISRCGDGKVDSSYGEACDPADSSHAGWGDMGCSNSCQPISIPSGCDETFYNKLRYGHQYTFYDDFHANSSDKWLWTYNVYHNEKYDYNNSPSFPSFGWTSDIINSSYKISSNTTKRVLQANSTYQILSVPPKRAYDNLFIKYTLGYSTDAAGLNRYAHSECAYYEITRCGDGTLDSDYETCDPADSSHAGWGNGGCSASCQPVNVSAPVCSSTYNGQRVSDLSAGNHLCTEGSYSDFSYSETNHKWTWKCKNTAGNAVDCSAIKPYCGDGIKDSGESCDYNDSKHAGWGNGGCSASCQPVNVSAPVCSSTYNGQRVSDLSAGNHLCTEGSYSDFSYSETNHKWTWKCKNTAGNAVDCSAIKPYCGDGIKDSGESCDYNDSKHAGWGNGGCDTSCNPINVGGEGNLKIEKTLIGTKEIKKVGDNVVWKIKVTAEGGDVTNFIITDKMPEVLGYSSYIVTHNPGLTVGNPTVNGNKVEWEVTGTLSKGEYLEIQLTTYAKVMPDKDYKNVACVRPKDKPDQEKCDDEPIPSPNLRLKKSFTDGTKTKTVNIGDEIGYKITFGNKGTASATITSIKDFLPKNVQYVSSTIYVNGQSTHSNNPSGSEVINSSKKVDGVYIDIYGGITLEPKAEGYIILTGKILKDNQDNRTNFACIYLNDKKIECDDAIHNISGKLMCTKPEIKTTSFTNAGGSTDVTCKTSPSGEKAKITLDCGNGTTYSESNVSSLTKTCQYGANSSTSTKTYTVVCKVNDETTDECKGTVSVAGKDNPPSTCFIAGTKVIMADGTEKNIEDVKIGEKIKGENGVNTVLGYDRPQLGSRHLWSINGGEYFVSDEHPFKTTEGWKSFNPEMTKLEIDLNTTELKVGDVLITSKGLEEVKTVDYIDAKYDTQLYNFVLDGDHTYYANSYLVHNKGGEDPHCKAPEITSDGTYKRKVTCKTDNGEDYLIGIKCSSNDTIHVSKEKTSSFTYTCSYSSNGNYDIQCYVPKSKSATTVTEDDTKPSSCGKKECVGSDCSSPSSSCFIAGTKVTMSDGSKKNIEDVKIGEKLLGENGEINTVLGYDRPSLGSRHLWSINGGEYFVSDEHPFKTTEGWKSFNPEMTKLEIDLNTTELKVGDKIITENGLEEIKTVSYINEKASTQLYNFVLDGDHTYHANGYLVHNKGGGSCFIAGTKVIMADGTEKNIEDVKIGEKIKGENGVNTVLGYDRPILRSRHLWSINGGEYFVSDEHPFKTTEGWKSFNPEMTKLEIDLNTTELKVGDVLITSKGLEEIKTIDYIEEDYNTQLYNFVLDGDHTYYADNYLVHNKGGGGGGGSNPIYDSANCFDVNTNNVSIEQGEILPFYWNIRNMKNIKDWAMDLTGGFKSTASDIESSIINKYNGKSCSEDDDGFIGLNSMICHFKITNGNSASNAVYEGDFPCLRDTGGRGESYVSNYGLLNAWMTYGRNKYRGNGNYQFFWTFSNRDRNYALRSNINYIENFGERDRNGRTIDTFGEYKLSLTSIKYLQCRDEKWNLVSPEITVCENNFTLTNPYTVQKTPSGNLKASTTTLDKYLYKNGNSVVKASQLLNAIAVTEYEPNNTVDKAMSDFTNKYQKLAVTVKNENGRVIKKVPGKNIYFVEGDITLGGSNSSVTLDKPVTFVQTRGNTTINGNVDYNMMLLTNGNIKFQDPSSCNHRQVVKGVFYAKGGISRTTVQRNNNLNNGQRCTEGGLTIKGVLIGRGLQGVMNESRSNLNGWFNSTDKKSIVMNGASVIIEYAPSVFTKATMPPGAEDFTTALSIYKN